ncbi:hypothetical protein ACFQBY_04245 [Promicromonospora citrea]|uniref:Uncharacterized protein n=1 Tax=Promicromonospora citrea TaxID=43677 RepID=A0A8H9GII4_9MICO|nr:hypothetical protein [Promicromonospora citrea]NNH51206.1 hypothetical protein [Promicromonospora citrea]GGM25866.1 hypothetical protein GCM10010102_21920 [Promicromonospora citrea]
MASTSSTSGTAVRRRVTHPGSLAMIVGGLCVFVGSVLPWISTPLGDIPGHASYLGWATMAAAPLAFAGAVLPFRRVAIVHCLVVALPAVVAGGIYLAQVVQLTVVAGAFPTAWPGMGLVMILGGAVILLRTAWRLRHAAERRP